MPVHEANKRNRKPEAWKATFAQPLPIPGVIDIEGKSMNFLKTVLSLGVLCASGAQASTLTETSPTGGALPGSVSSVGGIVIDLKGSNGVRLLTQAAASSLFVGNQNGAEFLLVGTQSGFSPSIIAGLGGGIVSASVRVSLYDGDNQVGDFDYGNDSLTLNNISFGNFSNVATDQTTSTGSLINSSLGFGNNILSTGWFSVTDSATLSSFYASLSSGKVEFRVADTTFSGNYTDQFYDFTQGIDQSLINIGTGPILAAIPEPSTYAMMLFGIAALGYTRRASRKAGR